MSSFFIERDSVYMSTLHMSIVGTPGPGYPFLLSLGKSLVVIVNYALNNRAAGPLWSGAILSRQTAPNSLPAWKGSGGVTYPGGSPQPKQLGGPGPPAEPRTTRGVPDLPRVPDPCRVPDPDPHPLSGPLSGVKLTPRLGLVRNYHVSHARTQVWARARGRDASTRRQACLPHSIQ